MSDKLLFYIIKEYRQTANMAGKIWRIKLVSGELKVGDEIRLFGVKTADTKEFCDVEAVVKSMRIDVGLTSEDVEVATESDIITIDVKNCYANGKKINKNDILSTKITLGSNASVACEYAPSISIRLDKCEEFVEKLAVSIEYSKRRGYEASMLWFGNHVSIAVTDIEIVDDGYVATFRLNGAPLPIPQDDKLKDLIKYAVIKDRQLVKSFGRNKAGIHEWRYYNGVIIM